VEGKLVVEAEMSAIVVDRDPSEQPALPTAV
jgi:hypothetical protein